MNRRSLILGAAALIAAPAIVHAESLMKLYVPRKPSIEELFARYQRARLVEFQAFQDRIVFGTSFTEYDTDGFAVRALDPLNPDWSTVEANRRVEARISKQTGGGLIPGRAL